MCRRFAKAPFSTLHCSPQPPRDSCLMVFSSDGRPALRSTRRLQGAPFKTSTLGCRERIDRDVVSVWISECELIGLSVRIHVGFFF